MLRHRVALTPPQALALGLLQGPTELLPVSSSAHTALAAGLAGWPYAELDPALRKSFEVALHAGAAGALALGGRWGPARGRRDAAFAALSLAPPALAGYVLERPIEERLATPRTLAVALTAGGLAMALADARRPSRPASDCRASDALALGVAQALALVPGVSRSGATLTAARALRFERAAAEELSWRAALPVMLAALARRTALLARTPPPRHDAAALAAGAGASFASSLLCVRVLRARRRRGRALLPFALYRCLLAAFVIARAPGRPAT